MKNLLRSRNCLGSLVSRRKFLRQTAAAAVGLSIVPRRVLGGAGYIPPSDKVNIAFIGVGSQGLRVMLRFLIQPDVQGVAVCDPNKGSTNHPLLRYICETGFEHHVAANFSSVAPAVHEAATRYLGWEMYALPS